LDRFSERHLFVLYVIRHEFLVENFIWDSISTNYFNLYRQVKFESLSNNFLSRIFHAMCNKSPCTNFPYLYPPSVTLSTYHEARCMLSEIECRPWNCNFKVEKFFFSLQFFSSLPLKIVSFVHEFFCETATSLKLKWKC
jgi:hypothetical protein